jgi:TPR repeat protein
LPIRAASLTCGRSAARLASATFSKGACGGQPTTYDKNRNRRFAGVDFQLLSSFAAEAVSACERAIEVQPEEDRYLYQLARATQTRSTLGAERHLRTLVARQYPAAFDNLAWVVIAQGSANLPEGISLLRAGVELDDPQAMVSLAQFAAEGTGMAKDEPYAFSLLQRAAELGHDQASVTVAEYEQRVRNGKLAVGVGLSFLAILLNSTRK